MSKGKIVIIINNLGIGGAERLTLDTLTELVARGMKPILVTLNPERKGRTLEESVKKLPIKWQQFSFPSVFSFSEWGRLISFLRNEKPDMVITHLWFANTIGRIAAFSTQTPRIIAFEHNVYDTIKTWKTFVADWILQFVSTKIIAVSASVKESLIRHRIQSKKIEVILNGISLERYKDASPVPIREALSLSSSEFLFLFVGRLIHQKGVDVLIKAFSKVSDGQLLIVGEGSLRKTLEDLALTCGVASRTHFLGVRSDIPGLLRAADCFVFPSRYEGLPLALVEAAASGLPLIVSDFGSASEVVAEGAGIIVPVEDVEGLAEAMKKMLSDESLRKRLSLGARDATQKFSIVSHVDALLKHLYNSGNTI